MVMTTWDVIRVTVVEWLGDMYDAEGRRPGNPDYVQPEEVDELINKLVDVLGEQRADFTKGW